ncbi:GNAT family N-acetyltransferase [Brevibacillus sp. DP1.3A]|uniref:GNAT family N-acetyltransferase n=1 Tax=Brevibacillus sp. DP1.3A TaxID=2738867 RepID=UPI00156A83E7|nr:GNAT family protein [Brevibacillus sp. DP1.3A]UED77516.1 GNAT family N-acetyltransferase [Brevibacillus sp. DP1.3A]
MNVHLMTITDAEQVATWQYPQEYSFYDFENSPETFQELLDGTYYSVQDNHGQLTGFFCFGLNAQVPEARKQNLYKGENVLDIGLGMKPDMTGKGIGFSFLQAGIEFAKQQFEPKYLRLSVASFNHRAIKVYTRARFKETASFVNNGTLFIVMTMEMENLE